jgi:hypothetical protein
LLLKDRTAKVLELNSAEYSSFNWFYHSQNVAAKWDTIRHFFSQKITGKPMKTKTIVGSSFTLSEYFGDIFNNIFLLLYPKIKQQHLFSM